MHYGKVTNPKTAEARMLQLLRDHPGKWFDVWSLTTLIPSACVHTVATGVRQQLPEGQALENKQTWNKEKGRRESYYRWVANA